MPLVQISMARGRSADQKRAMLAAVTQAVHETTGAPVASIRVWIAEFEPSDFMAGGETLADRRLRESGPQ